MPRSDGIFLLANWHSTQSDCTGMITSGHNFYAPTPCNIVAVDFHGTIFQTTNDDATLFVYPISGGANGVGASTRVASAMYTIASSSFGSYSSNTLRRLEEPNGPGLSTAGSQAALSKHLNQGDGINIAITNSGNASNLTGLVCQVWAVATR